MQAGPCCWWQAGMLVKSAPLTHSLESQHVWRSIRSINRLHSLPHIVSLAFWHVHVWRGTAQGHRNRQASVYGTDERCNLFPVFPFVPFPLFSAAGRYTWPELYTPWAPSSSPVPVSLGPCLGKDLKGGRCTAEAMEGAVGSI